MGYSPAPPTPPPLFSRGGSLLPSIYADARYIDAAIVSKASVASYAEIAIAWGEKKASGDHHTVSSIPPNALDHHHQQQHQQHQQHQEHQEQPQTTACRTSLTDAGVLQEGSTRATLWTLPTPVEVHASRRTPTVRRESGGARESTINPSEGKTPT